MVAQAAATQRTDGSFGPDSGLDALDDDLDVDDDRYEPVRPAVAQRRQILDLVPPPFNLSMIAGGLVAVTLGGTVGYWLSRRRPQQPAKPVRKAAAQIEAAASLVPVVMRLLANPLVRTLAIRIITRQIGKRIGI